MLAGKVQDIENPANTITSEHTTVYLYDWLVTEDSSPRDSLKDIPDSLWVHIHQQPDLTKFIEGNWLLKHEIIVRDSISTVYGIFTWKFTSSYAIYWDGNEIDRNGILGEDSFTEKPGIFDYKIAVLPQLLTPGKHTLLLRLSNYNNYEKWNWYYGGITIGPYGKTLKDFFQEKLIVFLISGVLLIPFLFNIFLFFNRRGKIEHLLFGLTCLLVICDFMVAGIPIFFEVQTTYIAVMIILYKILSLSMSILFPIFFLYYFSRPKKEIIIAIIFIMPIIFAISFHLFSLFRIMSVSILVACSLIIIWALFHKKEGSLIILGGILIAWFGFLFNIPFTGLALIMVVCTSFIIAKQFAKKEKAEREASLRSTRLENELLKKNINPHFLMNSLASIIAWLRKDPAEAIKFIEALAEEFRMIMHISSLEKIPILQEIELCRTHLKIMSFRKSADFELTVSNLNDDEQVPPMIFHTLIENGITHGYASKFKGIFTIKRFESGNDIKFVISNDGEFIDVPEKNSTGMGLQYVKTRLEENYPGKWNLTNQVNNGNWEVVISIDKNYLNGSK